ncbi:FecR family protein [Chitinophaga silvatica]|uniref:FecR family protein n=1 Tax=Chitinophaga silvatica TaxID=2282649 RepID=A0A3E1Y5Y1_9BACT|nr:FecR family protein [Chitinophaga silvatica]RFS20143.1 FecR family protein [Chitinophaga silvatica]
MTDERLRYLLEKYLDQTASTEELKEYNDWYQQRLAEGQDMEPGLTSAEVNAVYNNISKRISTPRIHIARWVAAAAIVGAIATLLFYSQQNNRTSSKIVAADKSAVPAEIIINNTNDKSKEVRLPDGTEVTLFAQSSLRFDTGFAKYNRSVYLEGKSFFDVAQNAGLPFTVYNHDLAITALGTTFTITGNRNSKKVDVMLHSGKVVVKQINAKMKEVYLLPGQQMTYNMERASVVMHDLTSKAAPAKITNTLSFGSRTGFVANFDEQPLDSVLLAISKGYNVKISIKNALPKDVVYTGQIREVDSLGKVLSRIAILHNLNIKATGKGFLIEKNQ